MRIVHMGKRPDIDEETHPEFECQVCGTRFKAESRFEYEVDFEERCHHTLRRTREVCPICGTRDVSNGWEPWN